MSYELSNLVVKMTGSDNEVIRDKQGLPNIMVRIPKMKMSDLVEGGSNTVHPAFIVNGVEKDCIYVSKYLNTVLEDFGVAVSWPLETPARGLKYDEAKAVCEAKGKGWHLMSNAEWSLLALLSLKNNTLPHGNNNRGKAVEDVTEEGILTEDKDTVYLGSGPETWTNDHTKGGIYDLNGNLKEWVSGIRLLNGEIQVIPDNNAGATGINTNVSSTLWKVIQTDGDISEIGDETSLKFDYISEAVDKAQEFKLTDKVPNRQQTDSPYGKVKMEKLSVDYSPEIVKALGLAPLSSDLGGDTISMKNNGERMAVRGGCYSDGEEAGIFNLDMTITRNNNSNNIGFRSCYIPV